MTCFVSYQLYSCSYLRKIKLIDTKKQNTDRKISFNSMLLEKKKKRKDSRAYKCDQIFFHVNLMLKSFDLHFDQIEANKTFCKRNYSEMTQIKIYATIRIREKQPGVNGKTFTRKDNNSVRKRGTFALRERQLLRIHRNRFLVNMLCSLKYYIVTKRSRYFVSKYQQPNSLLANFI